MEMETLKKERSVLRSSLTRTKNKISEILGQADRCEDDQSKLYSLVELMRQRSDELNVKDGKIFEVMSADSTVSEADMDEEMARVDEYTLLYMEAKAIVDKAVKVHKVKEEDVASECGSANSHSIGSQRSSPKCERKYKLPVLKLKEFTGELQDWLPFWSQFSKIHEDLSMADVDKMSYLCMSMVSGSPADRLVQSYPATGNMYSSAVAALKDRFGRDDLLTEYYIRELLKIVLQNTKVKQPVSTVYDTLQCHLRNLESLNVSSDNCAAILMPLVSSCLPEDTLQIWERSCMSQIAATNPTASSKDHLQSLLQFLKAEVEGEQKVNLAKDGFGLVDQPPKGRIATAASLVSTSKKENVTCIFCAGKHGSADCKNAKQMTMSERRDAVNKHRACYACLRSGHLAGHCRNRPKCSVCSRAHHAVMCDGKKSKEKEGNTISMQSSTNMCNVLMYTLLVNIKGPSGKTRKARLLIDTGSQRSYALEGTMVDMGYSPTGKERIQHALFGGRITEAVDHQVYKIHIEKLDKSIACNFDVLSQVKICGEIPSVPSGPWIKELESKKIEICDARSNNSEIEILVGADIAAKLWTGKRVELSSGFVAMETLLGWTLSGKSPQVSKLPEAHTTTSHLLVTSLFVQEAVVSDLWSLDVLGIKDPTERTLQAEMDQNTQVHFLSTVKVNNENRFEVKLPFVDNHPPLADNHGLSLKRLQSTFNRLKQNGHLKDYQEVLDVWLDQGVIEEVPEEEVPNAAHYLPHHAVIKSGSTTPVRPVFDASAKGSGGVSLNQCLAKGPNLIEKIPASLARFRKDKIGISGDIAKAFLQISVSPKDRDYLRFLWKTKDGESKVYRHCRVVFGVSCSPFLLESCLKLHLENVLKLCKEDKLDWSLPALEMLTNSFYVDNCLVSVQDEDQAKEFIHMASTVMMERGFHLRGWEKTGDSHERPTNVLGLLWDKSEDTLAINIDRLLSMEFDVVTKKVLLSAAHRLFDPIGIASSVALIPKLLVQESWRQNLSWNEEVAEDTRDKFQQWLSEAPLLADVRIPRWIADNDLADAKYQVHVFSDACKSSYATCVFLRIEHKEGVTLRLLAARARVAPVPKAGKEMTIPRLELLAASIATRLYHTVINDYKLADIQTIFWTDATTVLAWILRQEPWDIFVMNRIKEIRQLSEGSQWRHIPGEFNPADLPSRGCCAKKLLQCKWWEGPQWLREEQENWPQSTLKFDEKEIVQERKKTVVSSMVCSSQDSDKDWYYRHFSDYKKLVRMVAWILRYKTNVTHKKNNGGCLPAPSDLSASEFCAAERRILLLVQEEVFDGDKDPRLGSLLPFVDEYGLLRLKTKVSNRLDDVDFSCPIVLPNADHPVVHRLIMDEHLSNAHAGPQTLLALVRKRYWVLSGRRTIKSVVKTCVTCRRFTTKRLHTEPTPLPEKRVCDARVFEITGVDFAGPLHVKNDDGTMKKLWVCVFTCAVYRAVRFELVPTLSTNGFIQALRRFSSRQGRPRVIYSDNGTNFVGFDNACDELDWSKITSYCSIRRIEWRFNPPSSPWWGGWWERLIGLMKELLRRVLGRTSVDYFELQTIICECESVMNSRPLTYLSEDSTDLCCITPAMFLQDLQEIDMPEAELIHSADLGRKLKYSQELRRQILERFRLEYLGKLQLFANTKKTHELKVNDLVFVGDDNSKRINWPVGRIVELINGVDGHVRVVKVRIGSGVLTRPVQRVYPLELNCSPDEMSPILEQNVEPIPINVVPEIHQVPIESVPDVDQSVSETEPTKPLIVSQRFTRHGRAVRTPFKLTL